MKLNTLKKRQDFVEMSKKGSKLATKGVVVECYSDTESNDINDVAKLGFTASKKVGNSVYRNKAKRRLKESVRLVMARNPRLFKDGYHYNFIARYSTISRDFEALIRDIKFALHNIDKNSI